MDTVIKQAGESAIVDGGNDYPSCAGEFALSRMESVLHRFSAQDHGDTKRLVERARGDALLETERVRAAIQLEVARESKETQLRIERMQHETEKAVFADGEKTRALVAAIEQKRADRELHEAREVIRALEVRLQLPPT